MTDHNKDEKKRVDDGGGIDGTTTQQLPTIVMVRSESDPEQESSGTTENYVTPNSETDIEFHMPDPLDQVVETKSIPQTGATEAQLNDKPRPEPLQEPLQDHPKNQSQIGSNHEATNQEPTPVECDSTGTDNTETRLLDGSNSHQEANSNDERAENFELKPIIISETLQITEPQVVEVITEDDLIAIQKPLTSNNPNAANSIPDRPSSQKDYSKAGAKLENGLQRKLTYHGAETDWPQVRLISSILFLGCIQMFVIGMSEWPYMKEMDKQATSTFFGYVGSVSALGHAICAPLMGYWSSATGQTKNPMIAGRLIALVGCILYICLELFPRDRRYVMLACYTIFGISMSSVSVMRGYVAKISTAKDRARAISMFGLATMLAVTIGPMFQMFFTTLSFPGINLLAGKFWLNIYTGPIYVALTTNIASLVLIVFFFREKHFDRTPTVNRKGKLERQTSQAKAALTTDMRSFNMPLALTCIFIRMAATLTIVTINTTTSPLMMSIFGWSNTRTVRVSSFTQACVGVISLLIFIGYATGKLHKFISERQGAFVSCILFALFFLLTYPWSFAGKPIRLQNISANVTGCNPAVYQWCTDSLQVKPLVYLGSMVVVLGIAITLSSISVDTLYSRILGNIDQGTMQGFFLFCLDIINVLGPLVIAPAFTATGQKRIWPIDGVVAIIATIACIIAYHKFPH